ncbi:FAD-dependent oxidoreductase [Thalassoglobus polymorphus]|uniref:2,4-dichlorophenol 6-monooxygenase n=1 Tax=Thalassoglobus polymorphus TaxID=2527994 RepID=A0A517QV67_9PLAN|nr:FAD-dependent oxidoreductase [Thalassoglobus polymorphus]QDT35528.1 2,4-dichlorophenol 6-monooxygenase [Thalassoglobus polymorphus]
MSTGNTTCCIVGGGPAGIFLGYLLARSGISVTVLEKHADFLRDFRGDTIHPSTMQLLDELGLLEEFLAITDFRADQLWLNFEGQRIAGPTFAHLKTKCKFLGFVPQWNFLNLLSQEASKFDGFDLRMNTRATEVIREDGKVVGVRCESGNREYEIRADLIVAADGRSSTIRKVTDQTVVETGVPIDALWFRMDHRPQDDKGETLGWLRGGHMLVTIPRRTHSQVAMVIRKGCFDQIKAQGIDAFRQTIRKVCPPLADVAVSLKDWDQVKLLTVQINHLERWSENGLLFLGDAAHAMSPMGGVGINLAIQDAVAAANQLVTPLRNGTLNLEDLQAVQARREPAARKTQRLQVRAHAILFGGSTGPDQAFSIPWSIRIAAWLFAPILRRVAGRWIGLGFQPEQIETEIVDG